MCTTVITCLTKPEDCPTHNQGKPNTSSAPAMNPAASPFWCLTLHHSCRLPKLAISYQHPCCWQWYGRIAHYFSNQVGLWRCGGTGDGSGSAAANARCSHCHGPRTSHPIMISKNNCSYYNQNIASRSYEIAPISYCGFKNLSPLRHVSVQAEWPCWQTQKKHVSCTA